MYEARLNKLFIIFNTSILSGIALFSPIIYIFLINLGYTFIEAGLYLSIFLGAAAIDVHPKSWTKKSNFMGCIFMGKHYKFEIKLKIVQEYLNSSLG
ncbi:hypothetical protein DOS77_10945, partial [Staphylococcus felis]